MTAAMLWLWQIAGGYIISALGGGAAVAWIWIKARNTTAKAKKSQAADKGGEETAALARQLGEAAETAATINSAQGGIHAQSDDSLRDVAIDRWVRK